ncbi:MAG: nicotinate-nucleotide adenylyltransferase [Clostridia bacterium]|nr:nicotinate-nucleotide adenylyltransferase [Clostridia bacterium]
MQRLGIFGGTFNPPHKGHIYIAKQAISLAELDEILFIPCGNPPHKMVEGNVEASKRFEMTRLAIKNIPKFEISDIELKANQKSYTAKTLEKLKEMYPDKTLCFVVGGDSLRDLESWYHPEIVFALAEIIAVSRKDVDRAEAQTRADYYRQKYNANVRLIEVDPMDISSSEIRDRIKKGQDVSGLIDEQVFDFIKKNGIYKDSI